MEGGELSGARPIRISISVSARKRRPSPLGAGYLILVVRELSGLSQRQLAAQTDTSQPNLASLETGNRIPTVRTLMRIADAAGFELVIGLRHPDAPTPDPDVLHAEGFDLLGTLQPNAAGRSRRLRGAPRAQPVRGPGLTLRAQPDPRAARFSS